ncbi:MAG: helix-turn-helix domain-containing protein [Spirochaetales bacterium]|nr:helix-turn-helix domain-containing protein [Candidatus Physcosoma equi]
MFSENLIYLRKRANLSQEELAEKIGVSRQTLSKWETGESMPDIERSNQLAAFFNVTLDELVNFEQKGNLNIPPKGKHAFGTVTVGEKGQIVIPAKARTIFGIKPGDSLLVLGDENSGLALLKEEYLLQMMEFMKK